MLSMLTERKHPDGFSVARTRKVPAVNAPRGSRPLIKATSSYPNHASSALSKGLERKKATRIIGIEEVVLSRPTGQRRGRQSAAGLSLLLILRGAPPETAPSRTLLQAALESPNELLPEWRRR